jgi:hypothetical protein
MINLYPPINNTSHIRSLFIVIFLFALSFTYSQNKKNAKNTLFGKPIKTEIVNPVNRHIRCATAEYETYLQEKNPKRMTNVQFETWIAPLAKQQQTRRTTAQNNVIITIPVVVHIIHNGQAIGTAPNITDTQIQSQMKVLNEDFRKKFGTPGYNTNPVGADVQIQFALAQQDPNGNPTNGIDRVNLCQENWSEAAIDSTVKPATIWDPTLYLNLWTIKFDSAILGYAQFPDASRLPGIDVNGGNANSDGVVSSFDAFGSTSYNDGTFILVEPYNKGRTISHEVGHWLGLIHIWGDTNCGDDYCADTPKHNDANYDCPRVTNCDANGNEMVENYMDYTDDSCMNIFTLNQKDRINAVMANSPRRTSLKNSTKSTPLSLFANDAELKIESNCTEYVCGTIPKQNTQKITIYNRGTSNLTSAMVAYNMNGNRDSVYNWTGNLAPNESNTFALLINSSVSATLNAKIINTNKTTDQRSTNNSVSLTFTPPESAPNYTTNDYVFKLQQDEFGSETTWSLRNSSNATLYSGGPYLNKSSLPELITQNWKLSNNDCYTFTINDSEGDGLCCNTGSGYYEIKSSNGAITVASGNSFSVTDSIIFSVNLEKKVLVDSDEFYIYPNPAKELLNVKTPPNSGLVNNYTISNTLGQTIQTDTLFTESDLSINIAALSSGVYFIALEKGGKKKTIQFIKE